MSGFHDILFPIKIARGAVGGPARNTSVKTNTSGKETRNSGLYNSRRQYDISSKGSSLDELAQITSFFEARRGRLFAFRFKDPMDNTSCQPSGIPSAMDQEIGIGDGVKTSFQLVKRYGDDKGEYVRRITKPALNTIMVAVAGVLKSNSDYSVDYQTGIVTFNVAPANGTIISAGFEFDIPVRFDNDQLDFSLDGFGAGHLSTISLIEVL